MCEKVVVFCGSFTPRRNRFKIFGKAEGASGNRQRMTPSNDDSFKLQAYNPGARLSRLGNYNLEHAELTELEVKHCIHDALYVIVGEGPSPRILFRALWPV